MDRSQRLFVAVALALSIIRIHTSALSATRKPRPSGDTNNSFVDSDATVMPASLRSALNDAVEILVPSLSFEPRDISSNCILVDFIICSYSSEYLSDAIRALAARLNSVDTSTTIRTHLTKRVARLILTEDNRKFSSLLWSLSRLCNLLTPCESSHLCSKITLEAINDAVCTVLTLDGAQESKEFVVRRTDDRLSQLSALLRIGINKLMVSDYYDNNLCEWTVRLIGKQIYSRETGGHEYECVV
jgi:hypothetical protein